MKLFCPRCKNSFDWLKTNHVCLCNHCGEDYCLIDSDIPVLIPREQWDTTRTADPEASLQEMFEVAMRLQSHGGSFEDLVELYFQERSKVIGDVSYAKQLVLNRKISDINVAIADASSLLNQINKPFPSPNRQLIDIGCGLGFDLVSAVQSYYQTNEITGVDLSPHFLIIAKRLLKKHNVQANLICADISNGFPICIDSSSVGFITLEGVLEHLKNPGLFFDNLLTIKSFPVCVHLSVPYGYTLLKEDHFNLRFIGFLPEKIRNKYICYRLNTKNIDPVTFYTKKKLQTLLSEYFSQDSIVIEYNSSNILKKHYLKCIIYLESSSSLIAR